MESIMYRDPELEASFSFSCYDFNSALVVFSDDETNGNNEDEYIEIALQQPTNSYADEDPESSSAQELEFRVSFSSTVPFLEVSNAGLARANTGESTGSEFETVTTPSSVSSSSTSTSTLSCSSTETCPPAAKSEVPAAAKPRKTIKRRVQFRAVNSLLTMFLSTDPTPSSSSEIMMKDGDDKRGQVMPIHKDNQCELVGSRTTATKIKKTTNSGIIMNFLIKCRSVNIRTMLASFLKPYQIMNSLHGNNNSTSGGQKKMMMVKRCREQMKPFEKWIMQREIRDHQKGKATSRERSRSVFDVNLDSFRGVVEAMSTSLGCKDKRRKNYSSTSNVSTTHQNHGPPCPTETNSIQAAIAHCKRSLINSSEFRF